MAEGMTSILGLEPLDPGGRRIERLGEACPDPLVGQMALRIVPLGPAAARETPI
jgi:hypothetical protein